MTKKTAAGDPAAPQDDKKQADPPAPASEPKAPAADPAPDDAAAKAAAAETTRITAIVELCTLAALPASALGFIKSKASVDDVRAQLAKARADKVDREPLDATPPQSGAPVIDVAALYARRNAAKA